MHKIKVWKKEYRAKIIFSEYYADVKNDVIEVLKWYKNQGKKIAIWGGGLKGSAFLQLVDPNNKYISLVIDIKEKKAGEYLLGREIVSCYDLKNREIDVIFMMSQKYFVQNYNILKDEGIHSFLHDVDEIAKNRLSYEEIKAHKDMEDDIQKKIDTTKLIQNHLLPLLKEVDRVCKEYQIPYFLCAGSALGAVRHKGFIPWDDDIDIGMLRKDYERFLQIADESLAKGFLLMDANRAPNYYVCHAKVFRNHTALVNRETSHLKIHHGFYLDIFPFDIIPEKEELQDKMYWEQKSARGLYTKMKKKQKYLGKNIFKKYIANENYYLLKLKSDKKLLDRIHTILTQYINDKPMWIADFFAPYNKKLFFQYEDIFPVVEGEFEGENYPIPRNVDRYLTIMYGDYMTLPPENKRFVKHDIIKIDLFHNYEPDEIWLKKYNRNRK